MSFKAPKKNETPKEQLASYWLHKKLSTPRPGRPVTTLHASEVTKPEFCPRRVALMHKHKKAVKDEKLGTCQQVVFRIGRDLEASVRQWFAGGDALYGNWRCGGCATKYFFTTRPEKCKCGFHLFWYEEIRVHSNVTGISGGIDMLLKFPGMELPRIYELKSYDKEKFKDMHAPLGDHRERTQLYLQLVSESDHAGEIDEEKAGILYVSKGGYGMKSFQASQEWGLNDMSWTPFREYFIQANSPAMEVFGAKAQPAWDYLENEGPVPTGICGSPIEKLAQKCEVLLECFQ